MSKATFMKAETTSSAVKESYHLIRVKVIPMTSNNHLAAHSVVTARLMRVDIKSDSPGVLEIFSQFIIDSYNPSRSRERGRMPYK